MFQRKHPGREPLIDQPSARQHVEQPRQNVRRPSSRGRSSRADRAGLRVSELNVEMMVETAIVRANCRKNWPVMPLMKRTAQRRRRGPAPRR